MRLIGILLIAGSVGLGACRKPSVIYYRVTGGPKQIDTKLHEDTLSDSLRPLVQGAPKATDALDTVVAKERGITAVRYSSNLVQTGGLGLTIAGLANADDRRWLYFGLGLGTMVVGYFLKAVILTFLPEKRDYAEVLWLYNQERPQTPYRAPMLFFPSFTTTSTVPQVSTRY